MTRALVPLLLVLVVAVPAIPEPPRAGGQPPSAPPAVRPATRGEFGPPIEPAAVIRYRKCWAVIVGINYKDAPNADPARKIVPELKTAETDAAKLFDRLTTEYLGFDSETTILLTGAQATKERITDAVRRVLCDKDRVGHDDCVLFYFAGHGVRQGEADSLLIPWGARVEKDEVVPDDAVSVESLTRRLKDSHCAARHKLVILDSCHSGALFGSAPPPRIETQISPFSGHVFRDDAFQGMASSRKSEKAADEYGQTGHSPFTYSLLEALRRIPATYGEAPFTANYVFDVLYRVHAVADKAGDQGDQNPQFGWVTGDQGQFHFFPKPESAGGTLVRPQKPDDGELLQATVMLPGAYGGWWFNEIPWFIPSLRDELLAQARPTVRGEGQANLHKQLLREAVPKLRTRLEARLARLPAPSDAHALLKCRADCFAELSRPEARKEPARHYRAVLALLDRVEPKLEACDRHLVAVLRHRLCGDARDGNPKEADAVARSYEDALAAYEGERRPREARPSAQVMIPAAEALEMLCWADYGEFCFARQDFGKAAACFQRAIGYRALTPAVFQVYALVREAEAWQQLSRDGLVDSKLDLALRVAHNFRPATGDTAAPGEPLPALLAQVHYKRAWAYIDQLNYAAAEEHFLKSNAALGSQVRDWEAKLMILHNRHGLAYVKRFSARLDAAAAEFHVLAGEVRERFGELRGANTTEDEAIDVREQLAERLRNALERRGECFLYRRDPQAKEAMDDFARAARVCHYLAPLQREPMRARMLFKQALAHALPSRHQDIGLAAQYLAEAKRIDDRLGPTEQTGNRTLRAVAGGLIELAGPGANGVAATDDARDRLAALRAALNGLRPDAARVINRDDLEVMLLGTKTLLTEGLRVSDRFALLQDAEGMLAMIRIAIRRRAHDMQPYFRHHYDAAVRAMIAAKPPHAKGLIEATWEATTGRVWTPPPEPVPVLVGYALDGRFHFFLDMPEGASAHFPGSEVHEVEFVRAALARGQQVPLPAALTAELKKSALDLRGVRLLGARPDSLPTLALIGSAWAGFLASGGRELRPAPGFLNVHVADPAGAIGDPASPFPFILPAPGTPARP